MRSGTLRPLARLGVRALVALCVLVIAATAATRLEAQTLAGGWGHMVMARSDGGVWTWGVNNSLQLGDTTRPNTLPAPPLNTQVTPPVPALSGIVAVASGSSHCLALDNVGRVWAWGLNGNGQIGNGTTTLAAQPVQLSLTGIVAIAAGAYHSVALSDTGTIYAWGQNQSGQVGTGATSYVVTTPTAIAGQSGVAIGAGATHTLIVHADGTVWGVGTNGNGELGDGTTTSPRLAPVAMLGISTAVAVTGANGFSIIRLNDGTLKAVGLNTSGQLGDGSTTRRTTAVPVPSLTEVVAVAAASGGQHVLARTVSGALWVWGDNTYGQLGLGDQTPRSTPTLLTALPAVTAIGAAASSSAAVSADGTLSTWGDNVNGQLGDGSYAAQWSPIGITGPGFTARVPTPVLSYASGTYSSVLSVRVTDLAAGATLHFTTNGSDPTALDATVANGGTVTVDQGLTLKVRGWQPGLVDSNVARAVYTLVVPAPTFSPWGATFSSPPSVSMSDAVAGTSIRYTTDGSTPTTNSPAFGSPVVVTTSSTLKAIATRAGWSNSAVQSALYTLNYGTLATPTVTLAAGTYEGQAIVGVSGPSGAELRYTTNGSEPTTSSALYTGTLTLATTTTLKAKAFRQNYTASATVTAAYTIRARTPTLSLASGTYEPGTSVAIDGDPTTTLRVTLTGVDPTSADPSLPAGTQRLVGAFTMKVRAFKAGCTDSTVASASYTLTSPLGDGALAAGQSHVVAASPTGLLYGWGANSSGQVGDGTTTQRTSPRLIQTLTGIVAVAAGQSHTLAATLDGHAFAWGYNASGQLGDGTTTMRSAPVSVIGIAGSVVRVAAGASHSLALTADGFVYVWGSGSSGQLGLGSTASTTTPTQVPGLSNVVAIAAGDTHSLAVTNTGQLYAWGANGYGQLGDGTSTTRTAPTLIVGISSVAGIAAGASHSLARLQSGALYAWGLGTSGQLGLGALTNRSTPTVLTGLAVVDVAAGATHSLALRTDGVLLAFGANGSGQVGDGTTTTRPSPTPVAGPTGISTFDGGGTTSVAANAAGDLWTWGAGGYGQLADGTTTASRLTPQLATTLGGTWGGTPAPVLSSAGGLFHDVVSVAVSNPSGAAIMHYTTNGAEPTEADPSIVSGTAVTVDRSLTVRVRAWTAGTTPSRTVSATFILQPSTPTISPTGGPFAAPQTVTISTPTVGATVRYTLDGTDPTPDSPVYSGPLSVATSLTVNARALKANWTTSEASTASLIFNYGQLAAPVITPPSGAYVLGQPLTMTVEAGTTVRYTTDGSDPSLASPVYAGPVALTTELTIRAQASRPDWSPSPISTATYSVTQDLDPPTITASVVPGANATGWHTGAVVVSFMCADANGIASCPSPVTVTTEGANQIVSGTAIDLAGNQTTTTATINIDSTAPSLVVDPANDFTTPNSTVSVQATMSDSVSGLASATCNGTPTAIAGGSIDCAVQLHPGNNSVVVTVTDVARNSRSYGLRVGRTAPVSSIMIAPSDRTMLVLQTKPVRVVDQLGLEVSAALWTSSDPTVATVSLDEEAYVLTAHAPGVTTVTAQVDSLTAELRVTVLAETSFPAGTALWKFTPPTTAGASLLAHQSDPTDPEQFAFGYNGPDWNVLAYGLTTDGEVAAIQDLGNAPPLFADPFGGLVLPIYGQAEMVGLRRTSGRGAPWEYHTAGDWPLATEAYDWSSTNGYTSAAQGPDGTIYHLEFNEPRTWSQSDSSRSLSLVVVDGQTGLVRSRTRLPMSNWCGHTGWGSGARGGPSRVFVAADGAAYVAVPTYVQEAGCEDATNSEGDAIVYLVRADGSGASSVIPIRSRHSFFMPIVYDLHPDTHDGVIVDGWDDWDSATPQGWKLDYRTNTVTELTGMEFTYLRMISRDDTLYTYDSAESGMLFSARSGSGGLKWTTALAETEAPFQAIPGGAVRVYDTATGVLTTIDENGARAGATSLPVFRSQPLLTAVDELSGVIWDPQTAIMGGVAKFAIPAHDDRTVSPNQYQPNAVTPEPPTGIWAKSYEVLGVTTYHHVGIRIVPTKQSAWRRSQWGKDFAAPLNGNYYLTLGGQASLLPCFGSLVHKKNRPNDLNLTNFSWNVRLNVPLADEDQKILNLLDYDDSYHDDASYYCWPDDDPDYYNSNSYAHSLLNMSGIEPPTFPVTASTLFPAWKKLLPVSHFDGF